MNRFIRYAASSAACVVIATVVTSANATSIAGHRAFYEMRMGTIDDNAPVQSVSGRSAFVLEKECRVLYHFFKGGSSINNTKRESMFIRLLEGLTAGEAEVLCLAKDKKIGKRWKVTRACVEEAFPNIQWGNRS